MEVLRSTIAFISFSIQLIPLVLLGWLELFKSGFLFLYRFWEQKFLLDKLLFLALFFQAALSFVSWFQYEIQFYEQSEIVSLSPKWNFFFILVSVLNFFFLGFWKTNWNRMWFFSSQMLLLILLFWGYLEPERYFYEFLKHTDVKTRPIFYLFAGFSLSSFVLAYFTFQEEDRKFEIK
ncbi:hypothetical protein LPTSP4_07470 [Leptospira ryugenii]|uniref:Uncharacterized protein n=1 Tax=Leptospira ryugenii TaxID=1917863 RepID=A0A2P2DX77_9LEPT|nr:hypothetical protein [Leptospira ryugenii]GBF49237.1 hypothetical protein LPTSP4_07470 [Leptospira ryugenii]